MNLDLSKTVVRHDLPKKFSAHMDSLGLSANDPLRRVGDFFSKSGAILPGAEAAGKKMEMVVSSDLPPLKKSCYLVAAVMSSAKEPIPSKLLPAVASMCGLGEKENQGLKEALTGLDTFQAINSPADPVAIDF